jgi:spore germination protein YaaH
MDLPLQIDRSYEGFVLDMGFVNFKLPLRDRLIAGLSQLGQVLSAEDKEVILVIPPILQQTEGRELVLFDREDLEALSPHVSRFSLMTYDYSSRLQAPGPNAPLNWVLKNILNLVPPKSKRFQKLLVGVNFYGMDYGVQANQLASANAILGSQFVSLLEAQQPKFRWDSTSMEHVAEFRKGIVSHFVYYPSLLVSLLVLLVCLFFQELTLEDGFN